MQTFARMLADLDASLDVARGLGLERLAAQGRFADHRRRIVALGEVWGGAEVGPAPDLLTQVALVESTELASILPLVKGGDPVVLRQKLEVVLAGPVAQIDESPQTNHARNILFELNVASKLERGGVPWALGEHPDVSCKVGERDVLIECKRPFAATGLRGCLRGARRQLEKQVTRQGGRALAVIALSLSRAVNQGDQILTYSDEERASAKLGEEMEAFAEATRAQWERLPTAFVGIIFHVVTPAWNRERGRLDVAQQMLLLPLVRSADVSVFRVLGERLRRLATVPDGV